MSQVHITTIQQAKARLELITDRVQKILSIVEDAGQGSTTDADVEAMFQAWVANQPIHETLQAVRDLQVLANFLHTTASTILAKLTAAQSS